MHFWTIIGAGALLAAGPILPLSSTAAPAGVTCKGVTATIVGTDRHDNLIGTTGRDVIAAGKGWDHVDARGGKDLVCGGRGADTLQGGPGNDRLYGEADGLLYGEDQYGDDLTGGPGDDLLDGGIGLSERDRGLDIVRYTNGVTGLRIDLGDGVAHLGDQRDTVVSIEEVYGTKFADVMRGDRFYQSMSGLGGADQMYGRGYIDFLDGDDGDDVVRGGDGNDLLSGGPGTDVAYGGPNGRDGDYCNYFEERHGCEHHPLP